MPTTLGEPGCDAEIDSTKGLLSSGYARSRFDAARPRATRAMLLRMPDFNGPDLSDVMQPVDAAGFRTAWDVLEGLWEETVDRARKLPAESLHERAGGEWSFIETQRHLVFVTDAWVRRALLGEPAPWDPLDLPHDEMGEVPGVPHDRDARPPLDEVLLLRAERMATVRALLAGLTDERLAELTDPVPEPGYPPAEVRDVRRCLLTVVHEEWQHRLFAERDLAALTRN
jgi:hypothetical protein